MIVSLNPEMERFIHEKVQTGQFSSPSEVIHGALAVLKESEVLTPEALDELRRMIDVGIGQLDRREGRRWDAEEMKSRVRAQSGVKDAH